MANSQKVDLATDFTITDTDGNTVNLFSYLEDGKTVMLFFFTIDCGHCHLQAPNVDSVWRATGSGNNNILIWGFESSTLQEYGNEDVELFKTETGVGFPCFSNLTQEPVNQYYNVSYTPQIHIICPDKRTSEISFLEMLESIAGCGPNYIPELVDFFPVEYSQNGNKLIVENISGDEVQFAVYTVLGRQVFSGNLQPSGQISIDLTGIENMFLLRSVSKAGAYIKKIIL